MKYRLGDDSPSLEWVINTNITQTTVTATYTKPNGATISRVCTLVPELVKDRYGNEYTQTRIIHEWAIDDLDTLGIGKIQLRWSTATDTGSINPLRGWNIETVP